MRSIVTTLAVVSLVVLLGCGKEDVQPSPSAAQAPGGVDLASLKSLSVSVMGVTSPSPVKFDGHCLYTVAGKERKKELTGEGNISKAFRGERIIHCEVRRTSDAGWIQLLIHEDGKKLFESEKHESSEPIVYKPE